MSEFRQITADFWASPQISLEDVAAAQAQGFRTIVNNRPEGESEDQTPGNSIASAAKAAGLGYVSIPVGHSGFNADMVAALVQVLREQESPILAYCRSGTRSTLLWSLAQASMGTHPDAIADQAKAAGYDITPIRPIVDKLAAEYKA